MTTNILKKFAASTVVAFVGLSATVAPSQAADVSRSFTVSNLTGSLAGNSYQGSFSYDGDLTSTTEGAPVKSFSFNFPGFGDTLSPSQSKEAPDQLFGTYPNQVYGSYAYVTDTPGDPLDLAYLPASGTSFSFGQNLSAFAPPLNFTYGTADTATGGESVLGGGQITYSDATAVPEPSNALVPVVVAGALLGVSLLRHKKF